MIEDMLDLGHVVRKTSASAGIIDHLCGKSGSLQRATHGRKAVFAPKHAMQTKHNVARPLGRGLAASLEDLQALFERTTCPRRVPRTQQAMSPGKDMALNARSLANDEVCPSLFSTERRDGQDIFRHGATSC